LATATTVAGQRAKYDGFSRFFMGGHSLHFSGDVRIVTFSSGGNASECLSYDGGVLSGDLFKMAKIFVRLKSIVPD
jgi:hypothetical protein